MRIKEILKTDSLAGSRIIINNNFKNVKNEFEGIDDFFVFDDEGNRVALKSPYVLSDEIITKKISGNQKLQIFDNGLLCAWFDEDGDLIIRKDNKCELNVREAIENAARTTLDISGIANEVEAAILADEAFINALIDKLLANERFISRIISKILNNNGFINKMIDLIEQYAPEPTPGPTPADCTDFSVYVRNSKLMLHCNKQSDHSNDTLLQDYVPVEGNVLTIKKSAVQSLINEYGVEDDEPFILTYTNREGEEKKIEGDGTYVDYNSITHEPESSIRCEDYSGDTTYIITIGQQSSEEEESEQLQQQISNSIETNPENGSVEYTYLDD